VKLEEAAELYENAANGFKIAKQWGEAGKAFLESAECHLALKVLRLLELLSWLTFRHPMKPPKSTSMPQQFSRSLLVALEMLVYIFLGFL
jgi:hypothetical protein